MDHIRTVMDYQAASATLSSLLDLVGSPVALTFLSDKESVPPGVEELKETVRHCQMVNFARREGRVFYAGVERHQCMGGAWSLGLRPLTETLKNGQFYYKLGKFESAGACRRTIEQIPHLESGSVYATMYAPLEKTPVPPHVIIIIGSPRVMLKVAQSTLFQVGGRINAQFGGIQSVCADATAQTYITGKPNFSLGCDGSRRYSGVGDEEGVLGIPIEVLPGLLDALKVITGAPGSK